MAQHSIPHPHDPRNRQRSDELVALLARCPEHLFSTDDDEMASIKGAVEAPTGDGAAVAAETLEKAA